VFTNGAFSNVAEATNLSPQPQVTVEDANSNVVTGDSGAVGIAVNSYTAANGGSTQGALSCTSANASSGVATFSGCQITGTAAAGTYTLKATRSGLTTGTSGNLGIVAGTASKLVFTNGAFSNVAEATNLSPQPSVSVEDSNSNVVTGDSGAVGIAVNSYTAGNGGSTQGALSCTSANASSGVATFSGCQITGTAAAGTYTLKATRTGLTTGTSGNLGVVAGTASQLVLSGSTSNLVSGTSRTITATVEDASGNTEVTGSDSTASITFSQTAGSGTVTGLATVAASSGVATDSVTGSTTGSVTLRANGTINGAAANSNTLTFNVIVLNATKTGTVTDTSGTTSSTVSSVPTTSGATELVLVYAQSSASETIQSITGPFSTTPAQITSNPFGSGATKYTQFAWIASGNGTTGNVVVNWSGNKTVVAVVDVIELSGNATVNPIVQSPSASATSATPTATLSSPGTGDAEVVLIDAAANTTVTSRPSGFSATDAHNGTSGTGYGYEVDFSRTAATSASFSLGASNLWGTIALEILHG
jgi:hypothetical protein